MTDRRKLGCKPGATILSSYVASSRSGSRSSDQTTLGSPFLHMDVGIKEMGRFDGNRNNLVRLSETLARRVTIYTDGDV